MLQLRQNCDVVFVAGWSREPYSQLEATCTHTAIVIHLLYYRPAVYTYVGPALPYTAVFVAIISSMSHVKGDSLLVTCYTVPMLHMRQEHSKRL